jgi:anaerobic magnesium-protoporphyrin IX monomethyl ester cyclase
MMKVLFVDPPHEMWPLLAAGCLPPVGFAALAAYLEEQGYKVGIIDSTALKYSWDDLEKAIQRENPDVVGVTGITNFIYDSMNAAKLVKGIDPEIITIIGGPHFSFLPEETLRDCKYIDYGVIGEGEITLTELLQVLEKNSRKLKKIKGIAFREKDKVKVTSPRPLIEDLDVLPMPAYHLLPMDRYGMSFLDGNSSTIVTTSRGCPYNCSFCSETKFWGRKWRGRSAKKIVDELELLHDKYKKKTFWFGDDNFGLSRKRNIEFCDEILNRGLDINFWIETRIDHIMRDQDLIPKFKKAGLIWVLLGIESPSQEQLDRYNKQLSVDNIKPTIKLLKQHDILVQTCFMWGDVNDTEETLEKTYRYALELDADVFALQIVTPFPGTDLYEEAKKENRIQVSDYSKYDFLHAIMPTNTLSIEEVEKLHKKYYVKFWTRPSKLLKNLFSRNKWKRRLMSYCFALFVKSKFSTSWYTSYSETQSFEDYEKGKKNLQLKDN